MATKKKTKTTKTAATKTRKSSNAKRNPALEEAILNDLADSKAWLVYGDWLQAEGDPRGELVTIQTALETKRSSKLKKRESELLAEHAATLIGPLHAFPETLDMAKEPSFALKRGFIRSLRISYHVHAHGTKVDVPELLAEVLAHPSCAFVDEIVLGIYIDGVWNKKRGSGQVYEGLIERIAKAKPRALRRLIVGDFEYPEDTEISWTCMGSFDKIWKACPRLEVLNIQGAKIDLGKIDAPNLKILAIETGGLSRAVAQQIAKAKFPQLESLQVFFGDSNYGASASLADIRPILDAANLPKLKHLGLINSEFADDIAQAIGKSKILKQLETLNLSKGVMTDEGARALVADAKSFKKLSALDLSENFIDATTGVKALAKKVNLKGQREPYEEGGPRYVAVGE